MCFGVVFPCFSRCGSQLRRFAVAWQALNADSRNVDAYSGSMVSNRVPTRERTIDLGRMWLVLASSVLVFGHHFFRESQYYQLGHSITGPQLRRSTVLLGLSLFAEAKYYRFK